MYQTIFTSKYFSDRISAYNIDSIKELANKKKLINRWITALESGNLSFSKETQIDLTFLNDIFGEVLDYEYEIDKPRINLIPKSSIESKEPDAILGFFSPQDRKDIRVVIELKDTKNDLDRVQNRLEKISPVTQAFEYARKAGENCKWVMVSNIQTIRLYNKESDRYEVFNLLDLKEDFQLRRFFFLLHKDRLCFQSGESYVDILYRERLEEEKKIEKEFYTKYHSLRISLFQHLVENNKIADTNLLLEKTQKILDRIIFVCFCADLEIVPKQILQEVLKTSRPSFKYYNDIIWYFLKHLFTTLDLGNNVITKLNGGLFEEDEILNNLKISDNILTDILSLSEYDYRSDLNVNILGHIFEQSISDLEKLKKENENPQGFQNLAGLTSGKRKQLGIFYTPENITKYLVKETIGNWLEEQKQELGENDLPILTDQDYDSQKITKQGTLKTNEKIDANKRFWELYLERLLAIKVLDPACGSGAFLVECLNFLIDEYRNVQKELRLLNPPIPQDEYKSKLKQELSFSLQKSEFEIEEHILKNNLYGVDINYESVEITRLSLWLKTVKRGKILTDIDYNIQQGNSLISDQNIAGNLAFEWNKSFEKIMNSGGFDVIIGNPPYIYSRNQKISDAEQIYFRNNYSFIQHRVNTYFLFIEKSHKLLNNKGYLGFIIPNTWMTVDSFSDLREFIITKTSELSIINIFDNMFADANVDTCLLKFKKDNPTTIKLGELQRNQVNVLGNFSPSYFKKPDYIINFSATKNTLISEILDKVNQNSMPLLNYAEVKMGVVAYLAGDGKPTQTKDDVKNRIYHAFEKKDETWFRYFDGKDIKRYSYNWSGQWIKYGNNLARFGQDYLFRNERILIKQIPSPPPFCLHAVYVNEHFVNDINSTIITDFKISPFYLLALLNSKLVSFWFINTFDKFQRKIFPQFKGKDLKQFPILIPTDEFVNKLHHLAFDLQKINIANLSLINKFTKRIVDNYSITKITNKIHNFYSLDFKEFVYEINKQSKKLTLKQQDELEEYFTDHKNQIFSKIENQKSINNQIDTLVYELYKLTPNEINLIEK